MLWTQENLMYSTRRGGRIGGSGNISHRVSQASPSQKCLCVFPEPQAPEPQDSASGNKARSQRKTSKLPVGGGSAELPVSVFFSSLFFLSRFFFFFLSKNYLPAK